MDGEKETADIPPFDNDKNTRLHFAAARNEVEELTQILEKDHKIDPENCMGWTPLMMAVRNGNSTAVKILLEHKADATKKNFYGASIFLMAIASNNLEIVHWILQHLLLGGVSRQSIENTLSPFAIAVLFGQEEIVQYLIANSFNINNVTPITRLTPIMYAAIKNNGKLYHLLMSNGADPFVKNVNNQSGQELLQSKFQEELYNNHCMQGSPVVNASQGQFQSHNHSMHFHTPHNIHNPHCHRAVPPYHLNQQVPFLNVPPSNCNSTRKSSNFASPFYMISPTVSPIPMHVGYMPQIFFPADFNPNTVPNHTGNFLDYNSNTFPSPTPSFSDYSPNTMSNPSGNFLYPHDNTMLNHHVFLSPLPSPQSGYNYQPMYNVEDQFAAK